MACGFNNRVNNISIFALIAATLFLMSTPAASSKQSVVFPVEKVSCLTPAGETGSCISIKECPTIIKILGRPRPLSRDHKEILRKSQCGFENNLPRVCCEDKNAVSLFARVRGAKKALWTPPSPPDVTSHKNLRLLDHDRCGPQITRERIFGGNKTGLFDYPWMALIAYQTEKGREFGCGGSLINKRYVLTAAHCVTELHNGRVLSGVRLGEHDTSKEIDCEKIDDGPFGPVIVCAAKYQDFGIESSLYFPGYKKSNLKDDVALIRLDHDAIYNPSVQPVCLPIGVAATISAKKLTVTGWGANELGAHSPDLLMVRLVPVPNVQCAKIYRDSTRIWHKQMCAGGRNRMDSCFGDSGGPLQALGKYTVDDNERNNKYIQYGIVSFGPEICTMEGFPGVYTRVAYYLDWILDSIRE